MSGFGIGGFGQGLSQGFQTGSNVFAQREASKLGKQRLALDEKKFEQEKERDRLTREAALKKQKFDVGKKLYEGLVESITGGVTTGASNPMDVLAKLEDPNSEVSKLIGLAASNMDRDPGNLALEAKLKIKNTLDQKAKLAQTVEETKQTTIAKTSPEVISAEAEGSVLKAVETQKALAAQGQDVTLDSILEKNGVTLPPQSQIVNTRASNGDQITTLVNSRTGEPIKVLGRGPTVQFQPSELPGTDSQLGKAHIDLVNRKISHQNLVQTTLETAEKIRKSPPGTPGAAGDVAQFVRGAASSFIGVARQIGVNTDFFESGKPTDEIEKDGLKVLNNMKEASQLSGEIKSAIIEMAYAAAAANGQTGRGVSDKDFTQNLKQLGASSGNNEDVANVMEKFIDRMDRNFNNRYEIITRDVLGKEEKAPNILAAEREKRMKKKDEPYPGPVDTSDVLQGFDAAGNPVYKRRDGSRYRVTK